MILKTLRASALFICLIAFQNSFSQQVYQHPDWSYNQTIYEVNIRQYSQAGTFKEFQKHLPRLKETGAGILWIMPINPVGEENRKGTLGSYYSVKDYLAVNPEFGTIKDFKDLVNEAHKLGMYVIIDWVANHTAWDNNLLKEHPDWFTKDSAGNFMPPVADWSDVVDLNYDNQELRRYMTDALKFWVKECGIDGFRCDVAGMVPLDFWVQARKELDEIKPVFMLAEDDKPEIHKAFDMTYAWGLKDLMNGIAAGKNNAGDIVNYLTKEKEEYPADAFRMRFTTNHDENSWNGTEFERLGDGAAAFAALTVFVPGMPLLYSGQEIAYDKRLEFFEKDPIKWEQLNSDKKAEYFNTLYKKLFNFKLKSKVLLNGEKGSPLNVISLPEDKALLAFTREAEGEKILCIFNFSSNEYSGKFNNSALAGSYKNLLTGEEVTLSSSGELKLKPWEFRVLIAKR